MQTKSKVLKNIYTNNLYNYISNKGWFFFQIGIFCLLSAPVLASFFLLVSLIITHLKKQELKIKKKWFYPFLLSGIVSIISSIFSSIREITLDGWNSSLSWLGLMNWIPFYYFMWRSQFYLYKSEMRKKVANLFLAGSVPFIFSGFGQMWFDWHGPFVFMKGLVIWFQRAIDFEKGEGISAMFNNQNYAASWLIIIWPFCIYSFLKIKNFNIKKFILFIFATLIAISVYLTQSRNGIVGTLTSTLVMSNKIYFIILSSLIIAASAVFIIPNLSISQKLLGILTLRNFLGPRVFIYTNTIPIILERPLFGWGAGSFPFIFQMRYPNFNREPTHPHNLILEMANSYGVIFALIMLITFCLIIFYSYKKIFIKKNLSQNEDLKFNKAWWASFFTLFLSQMYDIQYFDFRISLSFWILLTGLACII